MHSEIFVKPDLILINNPLFGVNFISYFSKPFMKKLKLFRNIGPGTLVAAAFIGPGTVTVCSISGASFGFTLLWALLLSIIATVTLQEMSARLGLVYGHGLAKAVKAEVKTKWFRWFALALIISAILIGNSAYEAGNISGGALGILSIIPDTVLEESGITILPFVLLLGAIAFIILFIGNYKVLERILVTLVIIMSLSFLITAILTQPNLLEIIKGLFVPKQPDGSLFTIIGLIGTTVVPYNLFLHAALVKEKWQDESDLQKAKKDSLISIILGGLVSMAIVICAAAVQTDDINNGADLAKGLEPLFGTYARYFLGVGLFAAGITSAITAPMAAAYVAKECFGWSGGLKSAKFRVVWGIVLLIGIVVASTGIKPIQIIRFAQVSNGLLLPIIAIFLLWMVNKSTIMNTHVNTKWQNLWGGIIILITVILCAKTFIKVFELI